MAYIDGFFSFLTSKLLQHHDVFNALDYYGQYLCYKKKFNVNLDEDMDYLIESKYFEKHKESSII